MKRYKANLPSVVADSWFYFVLRLRVTLNRSSNFREVRVAKDMTTFVIKSASIDILVLLALFPVFVVG